MEKQIAVVTGSSSGFGLLITLELAKRGFNVIATMRDLTKSSILMNQAEKLGINERIQLHQLDVTSTESIQIWRRFMEKLGRIDILVNNAGFAGAGFAEEIPIEEYRMQFETNVFGVIAVTQAILPLMRKCRAGKIINVSSISGRVGFPALSPYIASKHALEGFSESLRLELKSFGIDVVLVEPGSFQTNIWTTGKQITERSLERDSPYFRMMKKVEQHLESGSTHFGDPNQVAHLIGDIAEKRHTKLRYQVGKGVKLMLILKAVLPWKYWEKIFLKQLK